MFFLLDSDVFFYLLLFLDLDSLKNVHFMNRRFNSAIASRVFKMHYCRRPRWRPIIHLMLFNIPRSLGDFRFLHWKAWIIPALDAGIYHLRLHDREDIVFAFQNGWDGIGIHMMDHCKKSRFEPSKPQLDRLMQIFSSPTIHSTQGSEYLLGAL